MSLPTIHTEKPQLSAQPEMQAKLDTKIAALLQFLKEDNQYARDILKKEMDNKKRLVENVTALTVVGAFIAGVQSQIVASTAGSNTSHLEIATNGFAFVGLSLDIIGTSFGVVHSLVLGRSIRQSTELLQTKQHLDAFENKHPDDDESYVEFLRALQDEMAARKMFWSIRVDSVLLSSSDRFSTHLNRLLTVDTIKLPFLPAIRQSATVPDLTLTLGTVPMAAMGSGIGCLLISVILFAAYSQHKVVWVLCTSLSLLFGLYSFGWPLVNNDNGEKGKLMKTLDWMDQRLPLPTGIFSEKSEKGYLYVELNVLANALSTTS